MADLSNINVDISVVLGSTIMPVHQLLRMGRGAVIETTTHADDHVLVLANNVPIAKAQVNVNGENIGITIVEMLSRSEDARLNKF
jgi:flagellar motor switch protein FliN/FliY